MTGLPATLSNGVVMTYAYDNANQLASITYTKGATTIGDLVYTYDLAGRRTKVSGSLARVDLPAALASAIYNANNQLTSWGGTAHSYDLNGNLTNDGTKTFTWNERDQLAGLSGGVAASFGYDGTGRRRTKTINGTQTGFVYDGLNFVQELTGTTPKANLITGGIDEFFQRKEAAATRYPMTDALGSVIALTDVAGVMATEYSYEAYGKAARSGAADANSQSFTGREDDGTGLYYYRARYYSPLRASFISMDPIGISSGPNLYQYVFSNPVSGFDPLGLDDWWRTPSWATPDKAGEAAVCSILKRSFGEGVEYGGWIVRNSDGTYGYTGPFTQGVSSEVNIGPMPRNAAGSYHTHPPDDPGTGGASFYSAQDINNIDRHGVPGYLGIPSSKVKRYLYGTTSTIGCCE